MNWYASIFILHYEQDDLTNQCIDSLEDQAITADARIVVIDNGSPKPYVLRHKGLVEVRRYEEGLHLVPAFGRAMPFYPNEVYGLLNNDLICAPGMLKTVLDVFDDPDVGIVAPGSSDVNTGVLHVPYPWPWGNIETGQVDNHCIWLNYALVEEIGYPETDGHTHRASWAWNKYYCWLARQADYKVIAARDAYVKHLGGHGDPIADAAGQAWLAQRMGERMPEAQ